MPAKDQTPSAPFTTGGPAEGAEAVTPHDSNDFTYTSRGIWVGGAGNVAVVMKSGQVVTYSAVPAGSILPVRATRVNASNTTATLMVAMY